VNRFAIAQPKSYAEAGALLSEPRFKLPILKAGGMDVVDRLKEGLIEPDLIINIKRLRAEGAVGVLSAANGTLRIEAGATLADIAGARLIIENAPVLSQSCGSAATPQVRNVATAAGNLLQRPRCWYYRNDQFDCLKKGGPTCYAAIGENRYHAIFGDGPCHIVHPSNLAIGLMVCDGVVHLVGGKRASLKLSELYHMPDKGIRDEHNLEKNEVVTHITCSPAPKSGFYAIKEKQSFDWPVVAAAVALILDGDTIKSARVCAGAVAPVPWPLPKVEEALKGVSLADDGALRKACALAADSAKPMTQNAYKTKLLPVAVRRAVLRAAGKLQEESHS
jgi:xanthine dehydrogenase YagS FAD-binding subunit